METMFLLVNRVRVALNRIQATLPNLKSKENEPCGHVLQILIPHEEGKAPELFHELTRILKTRYNGVMNRTWEADEEKEMWQNESHAKLEGNNAEIRVLQGHELEVIDLLRGHGFCVKQTD